MGVIAYLASQIDRALGNPSFAVPLVALTFLLALVPIMTWFRNKDPFKPVGKHCYIGGASEGLGLALACQLAERGAHVTIVSRSQSKLDKALKLVETYRQSPSQHLACFVCDLTDSSAAASTLNSACSSLSQQTSRPISAPDYLFACAGTSTPGLFTEISAEEHWKAMELNFKTCLCTIHEGIKKMKQEGKEGGRVILTASILAMMGFVGYSNYCPSKYAIRGLAESLRNELQLYGIKVHLFLPATILSPGFEQEQKTKPEVTKKIEGPDEGISPEKCAKSLIRGLERDEFYMTYEPVGHMLRNSRGMTPRNNSLIDTFWGLIGTIAFPVWRVLSPDGEVRKEARKLRLAREKSTPL